MKKGGKNKVLILLLKQIQENHENKVLQKKKKNIKIDLK